MNQPIPTNLTLVSRNRSFGGWQSVYRHHSAVLDCEMNFGVYLPPQAETQSCPVLYWLSGLTCTEQNFISKAGAQQFAAQYGVIVVAPDTSPRGCNVPGEEDSWDLGTGAGFYVNATQMPWAKHYRMYDYVVSELPEAIAANFPVMAIRGIFGHSMGGYGALAIALKNPGMFKSVSAFSPIVTPSLVPWGQKAFQNYLGNNKSDWLAYDPMHLIKSVPERLPILIDQGDADQFLGEQLQPDIFAQACAEVNHPLTLRKQPGYDHSYYFIASFIGEHFAHHAAALAQPGF
ncbi:S-formylglutathione hydrolase [Coleofasciculus sp. FACHB-64]|uniref:S-formylglutathione hydrolase n=1 Tax=Cyanophyceae TaxID=3028117 RepID=UPI001689A44B|nr:MULTISPECIES: S-formylglutathione hydrolase [unclassified Coleofasciculus]MBD1840248.1 S-formylglutathione hydrolase [Coleofasciculus sp. FACHB-501]MBD2048317.1 S-formylglutathione hydrolase [Coleofasciculus sp. FACHB-64]